MKLPLQYITGEFYLDHEGQKLKVMNPEVFVEYYKKVFNAERINSKALIFVENDIYYFERSYEVRTAGNCIEAGFFKCQDHNGNCQKETRCKNETDVAYLLPQEEQKPECNHQYSRSMTEPRPRKCVKCGEVEEQKIKGLFAGDYPENMMTTALKAMNEEQKSELKPTDAGFKWFTCPTCDGKGSVPQDKSVEVIQQEKTAIEFAEWIVLMKYRWSYKREAWMIDHQLTKEVKTKSHADLYSDFIESKQQKG